MLAPGAIFRPHLQPSAWMRFNVAIRDNADASRLPHSVAETFRP